MYVSVSPFDTYYSFMINGARIHLSYEKWSLPTTNRNKWNRMRIDRITHDLFDALNSEESNNQTAYQFIV